MENIIQLNVEIDCDINTAFDMFTQNRLLESWLTAKAEVEPKVGGKFELYWVPENREHDSTIGCKITGIEKPFCLSFDWKGPQKFESFMNFADPLTHVIAFFKRLKPPQIKQLFIYSIQAGEKLQNGRKLVIGLKKRG